MSAKINKLYIYRLFLLSVLLAQPCLAHAANQDSSSYLIYSVMREVGFSHNEAKVTSTASYGIDWNQTTTLKDWVSFKDALMAKLQLPINPILEKEFEDAVIETLSKQAIDRVSEAQRLPFSLWLHAVLLDKGYQNGLFFFATSLSAVDNAVKDINPYYAIALSDPQTQLPPKQSALYQDFRNISSTAPQKWVSLGKLSHFIITKWIYYPELIGAGQELNDLMGRSPDALEELYDKGRLTKLILELKSLYCEAFAQIKGKFSCGDGIAGIPSVGPWQTDEEFKQVMANELVTITENEFVLYNKLAKKGKSDRATAPLGKDDEEKSIMTDFGKLTLWTEMHHSLNGVIQKVREQVASWFNKDEEQLKYKGIAYEETGKVITSNWPTDLNTLLNTLQTSADSLPILQIINTSPIDINLVGEAGSANVTIRFKNNGGKKTLPKANAVFLAFDDSFRLVGYDSQKLSVALNPGETTKITLGTGIKATDKNLIVIGRILTDGKGNGADFVGSTIHFNKNGSDTLAATVPSEVPFILLPELVLGPDVISVNDSTVKLRVLAWQLASQSPAEMTATLFVKIGNQKAPIISKPVIVGSNEQYFEFQFEPFDLQQALTIIGEYGNVIPVGIKIEGLVLDGSNKTFEYALNDFNIKLAPVVTQQPIAAQELKITTDDLIPANNTLEFRSNDPALLSVPSPIIHGLNIYVTPLSGESNKTTLSMPSKGWQKTTSGYKYSNKLKMNNACSSARINTNGDLPLLEIICQGSAITSEPPFLDNMPDPQEVPVGVTIEFLSKMHYCAEFKAPYISNTNNTFISGVSQAPRTCPGNQ